MPAPAVMLPDSAVVAETLDELPALKRKLRKPRLVLIGAGQAHLRILDWWRERPIRGVQLTLVSALPHAISGRLLPSVLSGMLPEEAASIDLSRLTARCGTEFLIDKVIGLDAETRTLDLVHHDELLFDVASINIGSANVRDDLCQTHRLLVAVKPFGSFADRFERRWQELTSQWQQSAGTEVLQLAVVGGGATGVELALALERRAHREGWPAEVHLIEALSEILPEYSARATRLARKFLSKRGVTLHLGSPVIDCDDEGPSTLVLASGEGIRADLAIWAAGAAPPGMLPGFQLPQRSSGYVAVRRTLQTVADLPVFAAGDVAEIAGLPCPKSGEIAASQAPVLWENLRRWFRGGSLTEYSLPRRCPQFLSCGDGTAIVEYLGWAMQSPWLGRRKISRDLQFVQRLQE